MEAWKHFQVSCASDLMADSFKLVREEGYKQFEKIAKSGWEELFSMGGGFTPTFPWTQAPFGLGVSELFGGRDTFKDLLKMMSGELNRFSAIPPVGLSRNYQEKIVGVVEKGNQFLLTLAEYLFLMFTPLEQSMKMVQATMTGLSDEKRRTLTSETVYETWLKELEQGYFALYGSEEYLGLLKRLVSAMGEFNMARQNFMADCLKLMGIPSENDLDDLYRDLYSIKKKLSTLENAVDKMAAQPFVAPETVETATASPRTAPVARKVEEAPSVAAKSQNDGEKREAEPKGPLRATRPAEEAKAPSSGPSVGAATLEKGDGARRAASKTADKQPSKPLKQAAKPAGKNP